MSNVKRMYNKDDRTSLKVAVAMMADYDDLFRGHSTDDLAKLTYNCLRNIPGTTIPDSQLRDELVLAQLGLQLMTEVVANALDSLSDVPETEWTGMRGSEVKKQLSERHNLATGRTTKH